MILIKNRLNAGSFSNLNAVIGWYWYSMRTEIPIYVSWDGISDQNIFDIFFEQKYQYQLHNYEHPAFPQHSSLYTDQIKEAWKEDIGNELFNKHDGWLFCKGAVYTEPTFDHLRQLYNYIYTENLKLRPNVVIPMAFDKKTLGFNYRYIFNYFTNDGKETPFTELMSLETYHKKCLEEVEKTFESGGFEQIYIASSQKPFFEICLKKFKDKMLYIPMKRLEETDPAYGRTELIRGNSLQTEISNVLTDAINLSNCHQVLVCPCNISFGVLYMNPSINYEVIDFLKQTHTG